MNRELAACALFFAGTAFAEGIVSADPLPNGKTIFDAKCVMCHGADGKGKAAMAKMFKIEISALNLASEKTAAMKDDELLKAIKSGKGKMPAYAQKLKPEELKAVLEYVRGLPAKKAGAPVSAPSTEKQKSK